MNMNISKGVGQHTEQNVQFTDQNAGWNYTIPSNPDQTYDVAYTQDATLEEFFARPIRIATYQWAPATTLSYTLDPWTAFFASVRITNRINNYNLLRAKLHLKFMINGNAFYYGRLLVSYTPRPATIHGFPLLRPLVPQDKIRMTQLPHVFLDPTTSEGASMELPFFHPYNALSIPGANFSELGQLDFIDLTPLAHTAASTTPITVSVFAWATDVHLSIPTSTRCGAITAQMGDEYGEGPISKPAAILAKAAGALQDVPYIAPYAKATQMAAGKVGQVARIFGYSRPADVQPSSKIKPEYVGNIANTDVSDSVAKLTLDVKQEVTVDPRVVGLDSSDELSILSLAKRESFFASFPWNSNNLPDTVLYSKYVTPMTYGTYGSGLSQEFHLTPIAFATLPFRFWRGSIKFRFQIVSAGFHRGRLRVAFDPYLLQSASIGEYNINYSRIVDIATERDFTVEFGWGQTQTWLESPALNSLLPSGVVGSVLTTVPISVGANGLFTISVVNDLTNSAGTAATVSVNVFISAGDDFEVAVPSCENIANLSYAPGITTTQYVPQMGDPAEVVPEDDSAPVSQGTDSIIAPHLPVDHTHDVFFGDPVVSFRQCLKRYNFSWALPAASSATTTTFVTYRATLPDVPIQRGNVSGALWVGVGDSGPAPWNYVKFTLLNYLLPAFAGRRGGLRWKYHLHGNTNEPSSMSITIGKKGQGFSAQHRNVENYSNSQENIMAANSDSFYPHTWCATHVTDVRNNPVIEAEIPFYTEKRFWDCRDIDATSAGRVSTSYHSLHLHYKKDGESDPVLLGYVATAEDFNLFFFCGVPPLFGALTPDPLVL